MLTTYLWTIGMSVLLFTFIIGIYVEWSATLSFVSVINELHQLTKVIWNARSQGFSLSWILLDYQSIWKYLATSCFCISSCVLLDRIPASWRQLTLGNRIHTSRYNNYPSLVFNETLCYLLSIPNLITLTIGMLQAYSTSTLVTIDYPIFLPLALYLAIYLTTENSHRRQYLGYLLAVSTTIGLCCRCFGLQVLFIKGNYVNLGVSILCWLFAVYQEWGLHRRASKMDERRNGKMIRVHRPEGVKVIRAENVSLGETIILREGESTPATILVERLRCIRQTESPDYSIGTYYDRETSGEDVSRKFVKGETLISNRELTRPDLEITGKITKYAESEVSPDHRRGDTVPHFLDNVRIISDMVGFLLLLLISLSVSASAIAKEESAEISLQEVFTHILAAAISANVIIPSMRMTLLYNVYNLVVSLLYKSIKVVNYGCIPKLSQIDRVIFDKTGTLTEECLKVGCYHRYPEHGLTTLTEQTGWTLEELEFALGIANNESNINPSSHLVWGTSPEESEIVNYWREQCPCLTLSNPLRGEGKVTFSLREGRVKTVNIRVREPYLFGRGKLAKLQLVGDPGYQSLELLVRQDGTSHVSEIVGPEAKSWSQTCEREDPRRSMSIAYLIQDPDPQDHQDPIKLPEGTDWNLLAIYSFENPLRKGIPNLIQFISHQSVVPYILTGDGCEAAEEVSRRAGFPSRCLRVTNSTDVEKLLAELGEQGQLGEVTLTLEGNYLQAWLKSDPTGAAAFLDNDTIPKVIYRASRTVKEQVARSITSGLYMGDAANDALAISHSHVGISLRHGAEVCRLNADLIMKTPPDLIGLVTKNGYRDMLLSGGERLLEDVCWMGGLTAGCLVIGLHRHGFTFLADSPLYLETWKPLPMLFVSSLQYTISVLAYASADCERHSHCWRCLAVSSARWHIMGLIVGMLLAWCIKNWYPEGNFSYLVLHALDIIVLTKHSWHCTSSGRPRIARRRSGGLFGNQCFGSAQTEKRIGFLLSILDSIPSRCLLYWVFTLLGEGLF